MGNPVVMHSPPNAMFVLIHLGVGESRALSAKHDAHGGPSRPWDVLKEVTAENVFLVHKPEGKMQEKGFRYRSLYPCMMNEEIEHPDQRVFP